MVNTECPLTSCSRHRKYRGKQSKYPAFVARIFSQGIWIINEQMNELQSVGDWKGPRRSEDVGKGECEVSVCVCTCECASLAVCTHVCCACVCARVSVQV